MNNINKIKAWYRLVEQKSFGNLTIHKILDDLGDPEEYIGVKNEIWDNISYVKDEIKSFLQKDIDPPLWNSVMHYLENTPYFHFISFLDAEYPQQLKDIYQPPLYITAIGDTSLFERLACCNIIGIVGTRKPTQYGRVVTEKIVCSLVLNDFVICSGLALGIDAIAHKKTVDLGGVTIAVLACGLDKIYPPQNRDLLYKIKEKGLIISENLPCLPFEKFHFPQRNRIIAALSKAVCVIEGTLLSGSLITAKFALDQGKEIYALPGDILRPEAQGPNSLIAKGAKMILTPEDIVADFNIDYSAQVITKKIELTTEEKNLYEIIKKYSPDIHLDQLVVETEKSIGDISALLFTMEMKDAIRQTENCRYTVNL